jgi:hypothetical protein
MDGAAGGTVRRFTRACTLAGAAILAGCGNSDLRIYAGIEDTPQSISLTATLVDATTAALAWTAAGEGLAYRVERNGAATGTTSALSWTDRGLAAGQRYCWRVIAYGGFGWQARSGEACIGTDPVQTGWRVERLAAGRFPAVAADAGGDVHVCFVGASGAGISWMRIGAGSTPQVVDADGTGPCSVAVDGSGVVHLAYSSRFGLRHAIRESGAWRAATVDAQGLAGAQRFDGPALALDADGAPRIAYRRTASTGPVTVAIATRASAGWSIEPTGIDGLVGPRSLAIDAGGGSRLATTDGLGQSVIAWRRVAGRWTIEHSESLAPNRGDGPPIALDASGAARLAWWQRDAPTTSTTVTLRWSESTAAGWRRQTVATFEGLGTRVAIAGVDGTPRVATVDAVGTVRVHSRVADAWSAETIDGQGGAAASLDLAIGADGQLRLVFDRSVEGSVVLASRVP